MGFSKIRKITFYFHHILSRVCTINLTYYCWCWLWCPVKIVFVKLLHCILFFSIFHSLEQITMYCPHLRSGERCSISLRMEHVPKLFGMLHGGSVSSTYLFIYFSQCGHRYLSYTSSYNPTWLYFDARSVPTLSRVLWLFPISLTYPHYCVCVCVCVCACVEHFLAFCHYKMS